jgi:hypothetical protein
MPVPPSSDMMDEAVLLQQTRTETDDKLASRNKLEPATTPDVRIMNIEKVIDVNRFGS